MILIATNFINFGCLQMKLVSGVQVLKDREAKEKSARMALVLAAKLCSERQVTSPPYDIYKYIHSIYMFSLAYVEV